jgi:5'-3' exonuclease
LHYNFVKKLLTKVTPSEGLKNFYTQVLTGDRTDNVIGLAGIGPVKAGKILEGLLPEEYYEACRGAYNDDERLHSNCKLLWVWRAPNQIWEPPNEAQLKEALEEAPIQIRDQLQLPL